jgi:hypothetical protein
MPARRPVLARSRLLIAAVVLAASAVSPAAGASSVDMRGTWTLQTYFSSGAFVNTQYHVLTSGDIDSGVFTGTTTLSLTGAPFGTVTYTVGGLGFTATNPYTSVSYTASWAGSVSADGRSMSGTWTDTNRRGGTFTATRAARRASGVRVVCTRGPNAQSDAVCTAEVGDGGPDPKRVPTGRVTWSADTGSFPSGATCALQPAPRSPNVASCGVTYRGGPGGIPAGVALPVIASYAGDAENESASGRHELVSADAPLSPSATACFFGGAVQAETRRHSETAAQCARRKEKRKQLYAAASAGFSFTGAISASTSWYLKGAGGRKLATTVAARSTAGLTGGPATIAAAQAGNLVTALQVATEIGGYASGLAAGGASTLAAVDPPDPRYRVVPRVVAVLPARLTDLGAGLPRARRAALAAYVRSRSDIAALWVALTTAINRAGNAHARGEAAVTARQLGAAAGFARRLATLVREAPSVASAALGPYRSSVRGAWAGSVTTADRAAMRARLLRRPVDPAALRRSRAAGAPVDVVAATARRRVRTSSASAFTDPVSLLLRQARFEAGRAVELRTLARELATASRT